MHTRKQIMAEKADAVITLPGGFGSMDELFEILTWKQLDLHEMPVGVLNINNYYNLLIQQMQHMVKEGFLKDANLEAIHIDSNPEAMVEYILQYAPEKMEKKWIYRG
jgi:uncharacterized protein (TIGR00730 family)